MKLNLETASNILDALDGRDVLSTASARTVNSAGAQKTHELLRATLIGEGWSRGHRNRTDVDLRISPWLDTWSNFTDGQRAAFDALVASTTTKSTKANKSTTETDGGDNVVE